MDSKHNFEAPQAAEAMPQEQSRPAEKAEHEARPEQANAPAVESSGDARVERAAETGIGGGSLSPISNRSSDESMLRYKQIEAILESDLGELFNNLTPQEQVAFKRKGEDTAREIFKELYQTAKVRVKKIIKLIKSWLKLLPGINRYFLEQEAKIKADKLIAQAAGRQLVF